MPFDYKSIAHLFSEQTTPANNNHNQDVTDIKETNIKTDGSKWLDNSLDGLEGFEENYSGGPGKNTGSAEGSDDFGLHKRKGNQACCFKQRIFPFDMPVSDYPPDFITGWLLTVWDKVIEAVKQNRQVPF